MSQTTQERNKALVLEAFDALFNRRDYAAAERFRSPSYIQVGEAITKATQSGGKVLLTPKT